MKKIKIEKCEQCFCCYARAYSKNEPCKLITEPGIIPAACPLDDDREEELKEKLNDAKDILRHLLREYYSDTMSRLNTYYQKKIKELIDNP